MPTPNRESKLRTKEFLSVLHIECHNDCPALGMYARMWSPLGPMSRHCEEQVLRKGVKLQRSEGNR